MAVTPSWDSILAHPLARVVAGLIALLLLVNGVAGLRSGAGRGAGAAIVLAFLVGYWAVTARFPSWFGRRKA